MKQNAPDMSALFARLETSFSHTEKLLAQLIKTCPFYSCRLPLLYSRQIYQTELLLEIKQEFNEYQNVK